MAKRGPKKGQKHSGQFKAGVSGNPGGRKKHSKEFYERCRTLTDDLVVDMWREEVQKRKSFRMKAAEFLSAYGYGRPLQLTSEDSVDLEDVKPSDVYVFSLKRV